MWRLSLPGSKHWRWCVLGERTLLFEWREGEPFSRLKMKRLIAGWENWDYPEVEEVVPGYTSVAVWFKAEFATTDMERVVQDFFDRLPGIGFDPNTSGNRIDIPVCYSMGLDWDEVQDQTGRTMTEIIDRHSAAEYEVAMVGFLPGFMYLEGLDPLLYCPRKATPRVRVPEGSVGIGGHQTGVYSFPTPGGWQIIGKTPLHLFNEEKEPPVSVAVGDVIRFVPINEQQYEEMTRG
ncbi:MAG: 5-oxoprolinase subunit PxpB [Bacteroidota bacterium]